MTRMVVWWLLTRSIAPDLAGVRGAPCVDDDRHARSVEVRGEALNLGVRELHVDDSASRRASLTTAEADA